MRALLLFLYSLLLQKDSLYYVTHIEGNVKTAKGKPLEIGDSIKLADELAFPTSNDRIAVINPVKGRFIVRDKNLLASRPSRLMVIVSENIIPSTSTETLTSRAGEIGTIAELKAFLRSISQADTPAILLQDSIKIEISENLKGNGKNVIFYLVLSYQGSQLNNPLKYSYSSDGKKLYLLFDRTIFAAGNKMMATGEKTTANFFWYDPIAKESELISVLKIVQPASAKIKQELGVLKRVLSEQYRNAPDAKERIANEVYAHLLEHYGWIPQRNVASLLQ